MQILQTERLNIRELDSAADAEFIFALLNTPKFLKNIGDRGVRSVRDAAAFIEKRYRQSYREHGFGLYVVELNADVADALTIVRSSATGGTLPVPRVSSQLGLCGFVRRETLTEPDLGFAFLPEFERNGYGFESAAAMLDYGRDTLGFSRVSAITSLDNDASGRLLLKLGFVFDRQMETPEESLKLYSIKL